MSIIKQKQQRSHPFSAYLATFGLTYKELIQRLLTFYSLVGGLLANWFGYITGPYMQDPTLGFDFGPPSVIILRIVTSHIIALLIFISAYEKAKKLANEPWMIYLISFGIGYATPIAMDRLSGIVF